MCISDCSSIGLKSSHLISTNEVGITADRDLLGSYSKSISLNIVAVNMVNTSKGVLTT